MSAAACIHAARLHAMPHSAAETLARHRHQDAMTAASSQQNFLSPTCRVSKVGGRSADGYGAWFMCTDGLGPRSGVLSVGIGGDISFDLALVRRFGAEVLPRLAAGALAHVIDREFHGLEHAQAAHTHMESNAGSGKIVIHVRH